MAALFGNGELRLQLSFLDIEIISPCWSGSQSMVRTLPLGIWFSCQSGRDCSVDNSTAIIRVHVRGYENLYFDVPRYIGSCFS